LQFDFDIDPDIDPDFDDDYECSFALKKFMKYSGYMCYT